MVTSPEYSVPLVAAVTYICEKAALLANCDVIKYVHLARMTLHNHCFNTRRQRLPKSTITDNKKITKIMARDHKNCFCHKNDKDNNFMNSCQTVPFSDNILKSTIVHLLLLDNGLHRSGVWGALTTTGIKERRAILQVICVKVDLRFLLH